MIRRLTKRELVLILIASVLLACSVCFYMLASPVRTEIMEMEILLEAAQLEAKQMKTEADGYVTLKKQLEELGQEYKESQEKYGVLFNNAQLELEILSSLETWGLMPKSTTITDFAPAFAQNQEEKGSHQICKGSIYVTAVGKKADFYRFLNDMEEDVRFYISEFWMEEITPYSEEGLMADIRIECYMVMPVSEK